MGNKTFFPSLACKSLFGAEHQGLVAEGENVLSQALFDKLGFIVAVSVTVESCHSFKACQKFGLRARHSTVEPPTIG